MIVFRRTYPRWRFDWSLEYPDVPRDLNRWRPLVRWFLAIPHVVVLVVLNLAAVIAVVAVFSLIVLHVIVGR
jgi:hypothetical protein